MRSRRLVPSSIPISRAALLVAHVLLCSLPGIVSSKSVILSSIKIFTTHEWMPTKPTIYFHCQGANETILPDVKEKDFLYIFSGEESWQPLTELPEKKCRRCGLYEHNTLKSDDVFDEWELCPSNFVHGKYVRLKRNEFNATFVCPQCTAFGMTTWKRRQTVLLVVVSIFAAAVMAAGVAAVYKYWRKRKREQDQARFLKLFEEGDDLEDELALGNAIYK
ncbi:hypothetical protein MUK42_19354 [Musa troglodytarum]|uniref:DUF7953 domain-containing protein n=1 Tax=Musa troglodytarum TaxID=320322 RepID=A0A9E7FY11_9LILI|nr:hypothetical protein MUK42_19354 [Musa troglodytarum]